MSITIALKQITTIFKLQQTKAQQEKIVTRPFYICDYNIPPHSVNND